MHPLLPYLFAILLAATLAFALWYVLVLCVKRHYFAGKTCVVVGSASGIGKCVSQHLCKEKQVGKLILIDISPQVHELGAMLRKQHEDIAIACIQCDVSDLEQVRNLVRFDSAVHLLVLCAGTLSGKSLKEMRCEDFDRTLHTNVSSQFYLIKQALEARQGHVSIVSISSLMGLIGGARLGDYCASKFALVGLFEALSLEHYYDDSITFSLVCPWVVETGMFQGIFADMWWVKKFFPFLSPESVAKEVVLAAERGRAMSILPFWFTPLAYCVRILPEFLYIPVLLILGGGRGMDSFRGRNRA